MTPSGLNRNHWKHRKESFPRAALAIPDRPERCNDVRMRRVQYRRRRQWNDREDARQADKNSAGCCCPSSSGAQDAVVGQFERTCVWLLVLSKDNPAVGWHRRRSCSEVILLFWSWHPRPPFHFYGSCCPVVFHPTLHSSVTTTRRFKGSLVWGKWCCLSCNTTLTFVLSVDDVNKDLGEWVTERERRWSRRRRRVILWNSL